MTGARIETHATRPTRSRKRLVIDAAPAESVIEGNLDDAAGVTHEGHSWLAPYAAVQTALREADEPSRPHSSRARTKHPPTPTQEV